MLYEGLKKSILIPVTMAMLVTCVVSGTRVAKWNRVLGKSEPKRVPGYFLEALKFGAIAPMLWDYMHQYFELTVAEQ